MKLYFAYGANLNLNGMAVRCPYAKPIKPFYLRDWKLCFSSVATIRPSVGDTVPGALWQISKEDEHALDYFESYPTLYSKKTIKQDGLEFMVYIMNSDDTAPPGVGYVTTITQGYQDWNLDPTHLDRAVQESKNLYHYT
jgi:gamma-glutamylcyclotransferase (GGCT)/AIG2-like uncharacterized protein YtfP